MNSQTLLPGRSPEFPGTSAEHRTIAPKMDRLLRTLAQPSRIPFGLWRRFPVGSFPLRLKYDIFPRPQYAFCLYHAARLAKRIGVPKVSALEFGVAGGNGLLELERLAERIERDLGVGIEIYGFDTGGGLPAPLDYRDLPYVWQEGFFEMKVDALKARLKRSELVLGNVTETVPDFVKRDDIAPIGAVLLDLDYYSSTVDAMKVFECEPDKILPRSFCYYDDVISSDNGILSSKVGPLLAIDEFNEKHAERQMAQIAGFPATRMIRAVWNEQIYVHHHFSHPQYDTYIHQDKARHLPLQG